MAESYRQVGSSVGEAHFTQAAQSPLEFSRMAPVCRHLTTFNGGDIVPIYCHEVIPNETLDLSVDFVLRQTTLLRPVFGELFADVYAFFVPNRIVNESFVNVMGENAAGAGIAPDVTLAPLYYHKVGDATEIQVPVGSVADYYGFPTQRKLPYYVLQECHDLKFRGYLSIYNEFFRDQNYQPPIPFSKLNVYEGFFLPAGSSVLSNGYSPVVNSSAVSSGDFGGDAIQKSLSGEGSVGSDSSWTVNDRKTVWSALDKPLKANKLHDFITSHLPYPQKGAALSFLFPGDNVTFGLDTTSASSSAPLQTFPSGNPLAFHMGSISGPTNPLSLYARYVSGDNSTFRAAGYETTGAPSTTDHSIIGSNVVVDFPAGSLGQLDITQMRTAIATQRVYEALSRAGSRYREIVQSLFGLEVDDPFRDVPEFLGHIRRTLNNYQVAQTSESVENGSPQGNLSAYSYTADGGHLFQKTFFEHGYVHVFAVIRQKNVYSTLLWPDNFRKQFLDFYFPELANISEQPTYLRTINPFAGDANTQVFGYQEAWSELRYEPDMTSGLFRANSSESADGSLRSWAYIDDFNASQGVMTGEFLKSNAQEMVDHTVAADSDSAPQFFGEFAFHVDKTMPLPVYSVPGLDVF